MPWLLIFPFPYRDLYFYEDGKPVQETMNMTILDSLFKETMELVMVKQSQDIEFFRNISRLREHSKRKLQDTLRRQNDEDKTEEYRKLSDKLDAFTDRLTEQNNEQDATLKDILEKINIDVHL